MKIDAQNIEEVIFDFHEGNLSDPEKADLMDFMHKHPEYEREFALWAKSYHYASETVPEYGHEERFVKSSVPVYAKWMGFATCVCLAIATWYWWPISTVTPQVTEEKKIEQEVKAVRSPLVPSLDKKSKSEKPRSVVPAKKVAKKPVHVTSREKEAEKNTVATDSVLLSEEVPKTVQAIDSVAVSKTSSHTSETQVKEEAKGKKQLPAVPQKKSKRRRTMDLTPTDDILPFNSDF